MLTATAHVLRTFQAASPVSPTCPACPTAFLRSWGNRGLGNGGKTFRSAVRRRTHALTSRLHGPGSNLRRGDKRLAGLASNVRPM